MPLQLQEPNACNSPFHLPPRGSDRRQHNLRGNVATKEGEFRGQVAARLRRKKNGGLKSHAEVSLWLAFEMRRVSARTTWTTHRTKATDSSSLRRPRAKPTAWRPQWNGSGQHRLFASKQANGKAAPDPKDSDGECATAPRLLAAAETRRSTPGSLPGRGKAQTDRAA
jgi:hypothetical protein